MDNTRKHRRPWAALAAMLIGMSGASTLAGGLLDLQFEDADFSGFSGTFLVDNPYWPLNADGQPRTFTYIGETDDECAINKVVFAGNTHMLSTTDASSPYYLFTAIEIEDTEWLFEDVDECSLALLPDDSAIKERTLDWYAQDAQMNIWYLGEHSQVFEDECGPYPGPAAPPPECFEGSWEAGIDGDPDPAEDLVGEAGIVVPGDEPVSGEPLQPGTFYMQEVAYEAEDMAKVLKRNAPVEDAYPGADYEDCRKVKEWTALEPGASVEHKWYCAGPGLVRIEGVGGGPTEVEELVDVSPALP